MVGEKQKTILAWFKDKKVLTKKEAVKLIGGSYYCNKEKHTGDVLSRMVKSNLLVREKPGVFTVGTGKRNTIWQVEDPNQNSLF